MKLILQAVDALNQVMLQLVIGLLQMASCSGCRAISRIRWRLVAFSSSCASSSRVSRFAAVRSVSLMSSCSWEMCIRYRGGICGVHCENAGVIDALSAEKKAAGENGVHCHPETRPDIMEAEAVGRLLRIAEQVDVWRNIDDAAPATALSRIQIVTRTIVPL